MKNFILGRAALIVLLCAAFQQFGQAGLVYSVAVDTQPLIGHPAGPFSLDFQLNDGSGTNDGNNTAILSNFNFGTGSVSGGPTVSGGASGNLSTQVHLTDSSFINDFTQGFTPGSSLVFDVNQSTNVDGGATPDQFTFAILDSLGAQLPTHSFFDVFVEVDISSGSPQIQTFASDTSRSPVAGGDAVNIPAPQIGSVGQVPEPGTLSLLGFALLGTGLFRAWKRR